jgi:putative ABC transport system permease protein
MTGVLARRTTLRPADAVGEAVTSIVARPLTATATAFGTLLAVGWFVAVLGLVSTATGQVASAFAARLPTAIAITAPVSRLPDPPFPFPSDAEQRVDALAGVLASGVWWQVKLPDPVSVSTTPQPATGPASQPVIAASPGFLAAADLRVSQGRLFDAWDQSHAAQVCLIGATLARALRIVSLAAQPVVYLNDMACAVTGIISSAAGQPALLSSLILPSKTAAVLFGPPDQRAGARPQVLIRTKPGAAQPVGRLAPYAISQARPHRFAAHLRLGPARLGHQVASTLHGLFVAVGWVGLAIGIAGIAGLTMFSGAQRLPEYALRRAMGARRRHIAAHVLSESVLLGLLGGLAGASLGIAVVVLVAKSSHWTPVVSPLVLWPTPLVGVAAGLIAGMGPATRAAWLSPARALGKFPPL